MRELSYHRGGAGPPLVLLHGIGSRWQVWSPVLAAAERRHDVVALDLPGFGASPPWPAPGPGVVPGSVGHLADLVEAFLDRLGLAAPALAGSSLGGGIALELGRRGRASAVTAFAPVGCWGPAGLRWCRAVTGGARTAAVALRPALPRLMRSGAARAALCGTFHARPRRLDPADAAGAAAALAAAPGFATARAAFGTWELRRDAGLDGIPVTVAWGTRDAVLPYRAQAARARAALPHARHVTLPGCGHLPFADDPVACARAMGC